MSPVTPGDPFLGRIKARSVPPLRTAKAVKRSITKVENIRGVESISLFLTPYSQSPMDDADKVNVLNGTGPGLTPQEPLALVAKMEPLAFVAKREPQALVAKISESERSPLQSEGPGRGGLTSAAEPGTTSPEIQYGAPIQHCLTLLFVKLFSILPNLLRGRGYSHKDTCYSQ